MPTRLKPVGPLFGAATASGRNPQLPSFYKFEGIHPLCPDATRVFIMYQDRTKPAMIKTFKFESSLEVPAGNDAVMDSLGMSGFIVP